MDLAWGISREARNFSKAGNIALVEFRHSEHLHKDRGFGEDRLACCAAAGSTQPSQPLPAHMRHAHPAPWPSTMSLCRKPAGGPRIGAGGVKLRAWGYDPRTRLVSKRLVLVAACADDDFGAAEGFARLMRPLFRNPCSDKCRKAAQPHRRLAHDQRLHRQAAPNILGIYTWPPATPIQRPPIARRRGRRSASPAVGVSL
jgi:hypothetical protein